ncbi:hypothetical protein RND81_08G204900 [Saponaria officinalis]|uniref:Bifunctional inhibitor/plant lipid transfer protein/seed storage helical domain-containing protein n=1 Tax=Saponaria officinalis TaxID=3572 RepID=A0AAW1JA08_SAPOF
MATTTKLIATIITAFVLATSPFCEACCECTTPPVPPAPVTPAPATGKCPINTLKLGVCADVLGLVHAVLGAPPSGTKCCALIKGLADLEAAVCLCTALKANVLGIGLNVPIALSVLLSACQKDVPSGYKCPS